MSKIIKKTFSFENDLNFENLSILLNELGIASHQLTNEQKVCIEYPNISSESKNLDILEDNLKKLEIEGDKDNNKSNNNELTLNLSKNKTYTINVEKLFKKLKNECSYKQEIFTNSLKIFVSIFNNFNEDIFKWNLEDNNLFNSINKIQFFLIKDITNNNININEQLDILYKEHLEIDENTNFKNKNNEINQNDDFVDDFDDIHHSKNNNEDSFDNNIIENQNEDDIIFRNIYFLTNIFNFMNNFYLNDSNIDNIMRNITLFNSYIINDFKILLFIYFNLCIQINLILSKQTVDNFLGISSNNKNMATVSSISSTLGSITKTINIFSGGNDKSNNKKKNNNNNTYIPSLFFIDYYFLEHTFSKDNSNEDNKEKILLFNFVLKSFIWTYFIRNKISSKIYIKIFNIEQFYYLKENMIIYQNIRNNEILYNFVKITSYVNLLNDNLSKEYLLLINTDFQLLNNLKINQIEEFCKIYFPIFINCNMISFDINNKKENSLTNFIEELKIINWIFKFYLKIRKYKLKKYTLTFISNSFSFAIKKNKINKVEELYIKEITLFMDINHIKSIELINHLSDINNFNEMYKLYKSIIKSCNDYTDYDIGIRLYKEDIINKELKYYFAMIILKLQNYINGHKDIYKKLVLYENKIINPINCVYLNIKKKLLKIKNKQNNNKDNLNESEISFKIKEKNEGGVLSKIDILSKLKKNTNDSNADRNDINLNNFYKSLGRLGLKHEDKIAIYNFIKEDKFYFTEFILFSSKNIIFDKKNLSYDPLNILSHFNNNKCFIIIIDMSFIDLYIYLTDSFEINYLLKDEDINKKNINKNNLFFNAIISNIKVLKFSCKENFESNQGHIQLRNINFILNKYTFLQKDFFQDYKSLFGESNNIFILDQYTKINCIFGDNHITLVSNYEEESEDIDNKNEKNIYYEDYFTAFYSIFLNSYNIIKLINDKKLRKYNKLDIIYNKKILQIKDGNIQIKKICIKEDENSEISKDDNIIINTNEIKENKEDLNIKNEDKVEKVNNIEENINNINNEELKEKKENDNSNNKLNINKNEEKNKIKEIKYINHNLFKIKELFQYKKSFPLISLMLLKETEISNLSFLFYAFEEIFLSKKNEKETSDGISKKIIKFLIRFKSSKFVPFIFDIKYYNKFLIFFNKIINKKESVQTSSNKETIKNQLFENIVLFPLKEQNNEIINNKVIKELLENKNIFINLFSKIHIFKFISNKYSKNQIGKLFKFNRIINSMNEIGKKSKIIKENNDSILIYEIDEELLNNIIKINKKKIKLIDNENNNKNLEESKNDINECLMF